MKKCSLVISIFFTLLVNSSFAKIILPVDISKNEVDIYTSGNVFVKQISFIPTDHKISAGEQYGGIFNGVDISQYMPELTNNPNALWIVANRKNSHIVAQWVNSTLAGLGKAWVGSNALVAWEKGTNLLPSELNFAVRGDLILFLGNNSHDAEQYICPDVIFGQGSSGTSNNWWVFANSKELNKGNQGFLGFHCTNLVSDKMYRVTIMKTNSGIVNTFVITNKSLIAT